MDLVELRGLMVGDSVLLNDAAFRIEKFGQAPGLCPTYEVDPENAGYVWLDGLDGWHYYGDVERASQMGYYRRALETHDGVVELFLASNYKSNWAEYVGMRVDNTTYLCWRVGFWHIVGYERGHTSLFELFAEGVLFYICEVDGFGALLLKPVGKTEIDPAWLPGEV